MSQLEETFDRQLRAAGIAGYAREYRFAPPRRFRADFAWTIERLIAEIEGGTWVMGRHTRPTGFQSDCEKYNLATLQGWRVLRFTAEMVNDGSALSTVETALADLR